MDQIDLGRCRKCEAMRTRREVATRDAVQGGARTFLRQSNDLRFAGVPLRQAYNAGKSGDGANYMEQFFGNGKLSVWPSAQVRECHYEVEQEDEGRQSIVQDILRKSMDSLRRIIVPVDEMGGVTLSYVCPHCHRYRLEDYIWRISSGRGQKQCNWRCAPCGGHPNRVLATPDSMKCQEAKVFRAHTLPQGVCDNLINALKLQANQQKYGDSPVKMVAQGLQERSRLRIMVSEVLSRKR